jgi:multiple sugar transport system substrate-binding protein
MDKAKKLEEGTDHAELLTHEDPNRTRIEERYIAEFTAMNPTINDSASHPFVVKNHRACPDSLCSQSGDRTIFNLSIEDEYAYIVNTASPLSIQGCRLWLSQGNL